MNRAKIVTIILVAAVFVVCGAAAAKTISQAPRDCEEVYAAGIYDKLTPELISLYEREVALSPIVSGRSEAQLDRMAQQAHISVGKLKAVLIIQDLAAKTGRTDSISSLAAKSDLDLLLYAKDVAMTYADSLPSGRRDELKSKLKTALK